MKSNRWKYTVIVLGILAVLTVAYTLILINTFKADRALSRDSAELNATVAAEELQIDFNRGVAVTETVEQLVIDNGGDIHNFHQVARNLMHDFIGSIQLAPDGVVTDIYPYEGNEAGMIDLLSDPDRGPVVRYGMDHDVVTMQGPFNLKQGGMGIAVRNPVFLSDGNGERTFWGFTIAIIKAPTIFQDSFDALKSLGYDYRLSTTSSPLTKTQKEVASSRTALSAPVAVSFDQGECVWTLEVTPVNGWQTSRQQVLICVLGAVIVVFITTMTGFMLAMHDTRLRLRELVDTDPLTGVLSRKGYTDRVNAYMTGHPDSPATAVFLDIDDFKMVNDLYGHDVGDQALQNLAKNLARVFGDAAYIARTGGDEFGVFFPGKTASEAEPMIREASAMDQTFITTEGKRFTYTISIGYADYPAQAGSREELARNVDKALYNVKLNGKNGCQYYVPGMVKQSRLQFGFSQRELTMNIPGASFIREAKGEQRILFANDELIRLFNCRDLDEFMTVTGGCFKRMVHHDDYDAILQSIHEQIIRNTDETPVYLRYRIVPKGGHAINVIAEARYRHHEKYGEIFFTTLLDLDA